jgi:molybdopterin converting factor small subunit
VKVHVGSVLYEYTGGRAEVEATGTTVAAVLDDLERRFPGLRFRVIDEQGRIRPHMRVFADGVLVSDLRARIGDRNELHVLGALSGG